MRRLASVALIAGAVVVLASPAGAQDNQNCDDFQYQEDAQAHFNADPSDPDQLDGNDNDGIACEALPHRPASAVQTPTTAVTAPTTTTRATQPAVTTTRAPFPNTGAGTGEQAMVGGALLLVGAGLAYRTRRTPAERAAARELWRPPS